MKVFSRRVFSDTHDSVSQRRALIKYKPDDIAKIYINRINFHRLLGYEPLYTDSNILDGQVFQRLIEDPLITKKLKKFNTKTKSDEDIAEILVACRKESLVDSLVLTFRGNEKEDNLSGFSVSLIKDDNERQRFSNYCLRCKKTSVTDLNSLITLLNSAAKSGEIEKDTASSLEKHWRKCNESRMIRIIPQNKADSNFSVKNAFHELGYSWDQLYENWTKITGKENLSDAADKYWKKVKEINFNRSKSEGIFKNISSELTTIDIELITLHSFFFNRAYNREISRCNGASFDENISKITYPITEEEKFHDKNIKGIIKKEDYDWIGYTPEAFETIINVEQELLDEVLDNSNFSEWINNGNLTALQNTLDTLGSLKNYKKTPQWLMPSTKIIAQLVCGTLKIFTLFNLIPDQAASYEIDCFNTKLPTQTELKTQQMLECVFTLEKLKRDIFIARKKIDEN